MESVRAFLSNPYTWLGAAGAAVTGVWWWKMSATTANLTLVFAAVAIGLGVVLFPLVLRQDAAVRLFTFLIVVGVAGLTGYYSPLWTTSVTEPGQSESDFTIGVDQVKVTRVQEEAVGTVEQPIVPQPPPSPLVALIVSLRNGGAPSIAERFALWFNPSRGGPVVNGEYRRVPDGMELDQSDILYTVDDLAEKAFVRIDTGSAVRGRLLFVFPTVERAAFNVIGATLTLEFFDAWNRKYGAVITRTGSGSAWSVQQLPGLKR